MAGGVEVGAGGEGVSLRGVHGWLEVGKIDAGEGFPDVEVAGCAGGVCAVPIKDAVGGV